MSRRSSLLFIERVSLSHSGIDICTFAILTLLFRVTEKTATPTSVVLMAINTLVGFMYRELAMGGVEQEAVRFFIVCVPVVVIGELAHFVKELELVCVPEKCA